MADDDLDITSFPAPRASYRRDVDDA